MPGRLDRVDVVVTAGTFGAAEREAHDRVMPLLSRMALEADAAVEVKATTPGSGKPWKPAATSRALTGPGALEAVEPPEMARLRRDWPCSIAAAGRWQSCPCELAAGRRERVLVETELDLAQTHREGTIVTVSSSSSTTHASRTSASPAASTTARWNAAAGQRRAAARSAAGTGARNYSANTATTSPPTCCAASNRPWDGPPLDRTLLLHQQRRRPVALPAAPLMHSTGLIMASLPVRTAGGTVVTLTSRRFDPDELSFALVDAAAQEQFGTTAGAAGGDLF